MKKTDNSDILCKINAVEFFFCRSYLVKKMVKSQRCLYNSDISTFLKKDTESIFGILCDNYHGDALTTSREAWMKEIELFKTVLIPWESSDGRIVFEYDIPRLGKRIDVVLLLNGIVFCIEFKVGQSLILESDIDQG